MHSLMFSHSLLLPVSRSCGAHCRFCTFREDAITLLTFDEIESLIRKHINSGVCEAVVMSGESHEKTGVQSLWSDQGYASWGEYLRDVCRLAIENQLIPTLETGPLSFTQLEMLQPYVAAIHLNLENINTDFAATVQPGKNIDDKIETISDAGVLGIPVHTGVLIGAGESIDDIIGTLGTIEELSKKYGHIQTVHFQVVYDPSKPELAKTDQDQITMAVNYFRRTTPEIPMSVAFNSRWKWMESEILPDDLGRVFEGTDGLDWQNPFPKLSEIERTLAKRNVSIRPRFPVNRAMFDKLRIGPELKSVFDQWKVKRDYQNSLN